MQSSCENTVFQKKVQRWVKIDNQQWLEAQLETKEVRSDLNPR